MEYQPLTAEQFVKPTHDYLRVGTASPGIEVADLPHNVDTIASYYQDAKLAGVELLTLPELGITGYTTADLFHNTHVLEQTVRGIEALAELTADGPAMVVGAPLVHEGLLYNCGVMMAEGHVTGVVPKTFLPNHKEFYEQRWFSSGEDIADQMMVIGDETVPFGTDLLFKINGTTVGVEICEDGWAAITPSTYAALCGAEVIVNLSASNEVIGKPGYRRQFISSLAAKLLCAYVYASAGVGESVADVVYGGHQLIAENGRIVAEREPHADDRSVLAYDVDRTYLTHDRLVNTTWAHQAAKIRGDHQYRSVSLHVPRPNDHTLLRNTEARTFKPSSQAELDRRCEYIFTNLAEALAQRAAEKNSQAIVLGLSGGLDSTLALLVAKQACDILGEPYSFIHTLTMPGPASSDRTQDNARALAQAMGTTHQELPITELTALFLDTIGHDGTTEDLTFENTQARTRTELLMNYANMVGGMVEGTGDFSENAIGWCTYNGDHMSMYNPNADVPKTLARDLVQWVAEHRTTGETQARLRDILATPVSPELTGNGDLSQVTEDKVGPYTLIEFAANEHIRYGSRPAKIGYLATLAFKDTLAPDEVATWLDKFLTMHTGSQWKRDVMPNGPKIGTVSLSPRGDLRMAPNTSLNWYK